MKVEIQYFEEIEVDDNLTADEIRTLVLNKNGKPKLNYNGFIVYDSNDEITYDE